MKLLIIHVLREKSLKIIENISKKNATRGKNKIKYSRSKYALKKLCRTLQFY